jgi:mRNA-degrading endonuclease RelE of RelBE toxin-antitoxin system
VGARRRGAYRIEYDPEAREDLRTLRVTDRRRVLDEIEEQLSHEAARKTRNRFPAEPNSLGEWELRLPPHRVFYNVDQDERLVYVQAVIQKDRARTFRRGKEIDTRE